MPQPIESDFAAIAQAFARAGWAIPVEEPAVTVFECDLAVWEDDGGYCAPERD